MQVAMGAGGSGCRRQWAQAVYKVGNSVNLFAILFSINASYPADKVLVTTISHGYENENAFINSRPLSRVRPGFIYWRKSLPDQTVRMRVFVRRGSVVCR